MAAAVVVPHEGFDLFDEISDAAEGASPNRSLGDDVEPDLDLIEPRGISRGVVHMEAGARGEPPTDARACLWVA